VWSRKIGGSKGEEKSGKRNLSPCRRKDFSWERKEENPKFFRPFIARRFGAIRTAPIHISMKLQAGSNFGFTWMAGNESGPGAMYGENKAVTKTNGLTLHPYFSRKPGAGVRWTLVN